MIATLLNFLSDVRWKVTERIERGKIVKSLSVALTLSYLTLNKYGKNFIDRDYLCKLAWILYFWDDLMDHSRPLSMGPSHDAMLISPKRTQEFLLKLNNDIHCQRHHILKNLAVRRTTGADFPASSDISEAWVSNHRLS
jgi:hypothetical protein